MPAKNQNGRLGKIANKTPIPMAGLMLGLASTGNMVPDYRWVFGFFAIAILAILILKIAYDSKNVKEEMKNPAVVGVACTFPMAVAVLSTYIKPYEANLAMAVWIISMVIHLALMAQFTRIAILKFDLNKVLPCYFVVYVGFSVNAFIAPAYGQVLLGQSLFWFGFASFLALFPPLLYRLVVVKGLPEPMIPTIVIFASPASVVLYGYLRAYPSPEAWMVYMLLAFSVVFYVGSMALLPRILRMKFYPSYSSLTFPLVISGIATNATYQYFVKNGSDIIALQYLAWAEIALAVVFVLYVLVRYVHHFLVRRMIARVVTGSS
jgi:exfoliative toxin A/B